MAGTLSEIGSKRKGILLIRCPPPLAPASIRRVRRPVPKRELAQVEKATKEVREAERRTAKARTAQRKAIVSARAAGASYAVIGKHAGGISRQRVAELLAEGP